MTYIDSKFSCKLFIYFCFLFKKLITGYKMHLLEEHIQQKRFKKYEIIWINQINGHFM